MKYSYTTLTLLSLTLSPFATTLTLASPVPAPAPLPPHQGLITIGGKDPINDIDSSTGNNDPPAGLDFGGGNGNGYTHDLLTGEPHLIDISGNANSLNTVGTLVDADVDALTLVDLGLLKDQNQGQGHEQNIEKGLHMGRKRKEGIVDGTVRSANQVIKTKTNTDKVDLQGLNNAVKKVDTPKNVQYDGCKGNVACRESSII